MPGAGSISAVIPMRNEERYIAAKLQSLLAAPALLREIIVVDDASTDQSPRLVEAFASRHPLIRLRRNDKPLGANRATTLGAREASGRWLFASSANDLVMPGYLERAARLLEEHPESGACCAFGAELDDAGNIVSSGPSPRMLSARDGFIPPGELRRRRCRGLWGFSAPTAIYSRELYLEEGGYDEKVGSYGDGLMIHLAALKRGLCFVSGYFGLSSNNPEDRSSFMKSCYLDAGTSRRLVREAALAYRAGRRPEFVPEPLAEIIVARLGYSVAALVVDESFRATAACLEAFLPRNGLGRALRPAVLGAGAAARKCLRAALFLALRPGDAWTSAAGRLRARWEFPARGREMSRYWLSALEAGREAARELTGSAGGSPLPAE